MSGVHPSEDSIQGLLLKGLPVLGVVVVDKEDQDVGFTW